MNHGCVSYGLTLTNSSSFKQISIACSWMNIVLAFPSSLLNAALMIALVTSSNRRNPCIVLLTNLTFIDLSSSAASMPSFFVVYRQFSEGKFPCSVTAYAMPLFVTINSSSFLTMALISIERYTSVFYPYFHGSRFTFQNTIMCVAFLWLFAIAVNIPFIVGSRNGIIHGILSVTIIVGILVNIICYFRILARARKLRLQIRNMAARLGHETVSVTYKRHIVVGGLIIVSMVLCFFSLFVDSIFLTINPHNNYFDDARCLILSLASCNSFVNPMISCSFCPLVRRKAFKILTCKILCRKSDR